MNQKGYLTKHQYLTLSEPKGGPWPGLQVNSIISSCTFQGVMIKNGLMMVIITNLQIILTLKFPPYFSLKFFCGFYGKRDSSRFFYQNEKFAPFSPSSA